MLIFTPYHWHNFAVGVSGLWNHWHDRHQGFVKTYTPIEMSVNAAFRLGAGLKATWERLFRLK